MKGKREGGKEKERKMKKEKTQFITQFLNSYSLDF